MPGSGLMRPRSHVDGPKMNLELDGVFRPELAPNGESKTRFRPSEPTAKSSSRSWEREYSELSHQGHVGIGPGHLPERVIIQHQRPGLMSWPRNTRPGQPTGPTLGLERPAVEHAEPRIDRLYEPILNRLPTGPEPGEGLRIDRDPGPLHPGHGPHESTPTGHGPGEIQLRQHGGEQLGQRPDVGRTIIEQGPPLILGPRPAPHGQLTHRLFLGRVHRVQAMPGQRSQQAVAAVGIEPVGKTSELDVEIQDPLRQLPIEGEMTTQLGRREVGHEKAVGTDRVGRNPTAPEIILPQPEGPARSELPGHQTNRDRAVRLAEPRTRNRPTKPPGRRPGPTGEAWFRPPRVGVGEQGGSNPRSSCHEMRF